MAQGAEVLDDLLGLPVTSGAVDVLKGSSVSPMMSSHTARQNALNVVSVEVGDGRRGKTKFLIKSPEGEETLLRISMAAVGLSTFTTWGRHIRTARTQWHREGGRPRALSLVISLEGTMGLKAEL